VVRPVEGPLDGAAVDEEGGGRGDARARPRLHVGTDARPRGRFVEAGAEGRDVEVEVPRVAEEAVALQGLVILEQEVVVLPESILLRGALRRDRGKTGIGMHRAGYVAVAARIEREVAEHEADVRVVVDEIPQIPERPHAIRTLEVGEGDDLERG